MHTGTLESVTVEEGGNITFKVKNTSGDIVDAVRVKTVEGTKLPRCTPKCLEVRGADLKFVQALKDLGSKCAGLSRTNQHAPTHARTIPPPSRRSA